MSWHHIYDIKCHDIWHGNFPYCGSTMCVSVCACMSICLSHCVYILCVCVCLCVCLTACTYVSVCVGFLFLLEKVNSNIYFFFSSRLKGLQSSSNASIGSTHEVRSDSHAPRWEWGGSGSELKVVIHVHVHVPAAGLIMIIIVINCNP